MYSLTHITGDATAPVGSGTRVICHCCNDEGGWGSGFVVALSKRWSAPERHYREWAQHRAHPLFQASDRLAYPFKSVPFELGQVIVVQVQPEVWVANLIGQHRTIRTEAIPVRYDAIRKGLERLAEVCQTLQASVHMPKMGAGLARGDWNTIEKIVQEKLVDSGLDVTVYSL